MTPLLSPCHSSGWHHSGAGKWGRSSPSPCPVLQAAVTCRLSSARVVSQAQGQVGLAAPPVMGLWACDFTGRRLLLPQIHLLSPRAPCLQHRDGGIPSEAAELEAVSGLTGPNIESPSFV